MAQRATSENSKCAYVVGDDGLAQWSDVHADAWIGLLETHKRLTRGLDAELEAQHGLSLSAAEVLGRLAAAPERRLRLSTLAGETGLSLSRISRIVDVLEQPRAVRTAGVPLRRPRGGGASDRRRARADSRRPGLALRLGSGALLRSPQHAEIETLAEVFSRFAPRAAESCDAGE